VEGGGFGRLLWHRGVQKVMRHIIILKERSWRGAHREDGDATTVGQISVRRWGAPVAGIAHMVVVVDREGVGVVGVDKMLHEGKIDQEGGGAS
jgi:hypothetical protein